MPFHGSVVVTKTAVALHNLRRYRTATDCKFHGRQVVAIMRSAGHRTFDEGRLKVLENAPRGEPFYHEARDLSRILLAPGILALMTDMQPACGTADPKLVNPGPVFPSGTLTTFDIGTYTEADLALLQNGAPLPLSVACRIAAHFRLNDPIELEHKPWEVEMWSDVERNARAAAPGECPWCRADIAGGADHLTTCAPGHLLAPRYDQPHTLATIPKPRRTNGRMKSGTARGMKAMRKASGLTQAQLSLRTGINENYLARIEQLAVPLTDRKANPIALGLGCRVEQLYEAPDAGEAA